jgi:hypothetical protein
VPVEVCFTPTRTPKNAIHTLVYPGQMSPFVDFSTEPPQEFGILCKEDDSYGRFIRVDEVMPAPDGLHDCEGEQKDRIVPGEEPLERAVVTDEGESGTLVMRHVAYSAINHVVYDSVN